MTTKAAFSEQEWEQVLTGPPMAGMIVAMIDNGGMMRESFAIAGAYLEAHKQHGMSELLDEIVTRSPSATTCTFNPVTELQTAPGAERHKEHGDQISAAEQEALNDLAVALEGTAN